MHTSRLLTAVCLAWLGALPTLALDTPTSQQDSARPCVRVRIRAEEGWYKIPNWLAGKWHRLGEVAGCTAIKADSYRDWGMQQDRAGGIWHYHKVPYTTEVRQVSTILKRVVTVYTPRLSTPERFCIHAEAQNTESDGFSGLIRRVYGQVDDQTWLQQGNNVRCVGQVTANGQTDSHDALYTPISGYQPVDWQDGKDMKASFRAYLASHRLEELVS